MIWQFNNKLRHLKWCLFFVLFSYRILTYLS
ncbi:hypothetical protein YTXLTZUM_CDS0097 [Enterococcus phage VRE9_3]